jgi:hypothetical protein
LKKSAKKKPVQYCRIKAVALEEIRALASAILEQSCDHVETCDCLGYASYYVEEILKLLPKASRPRGRKRKATRS